MKAWSNRMATMGDAQSSVSIVLLFLRDALADNYFPKGSIETIDYVDYANWIILYLWCSYKIRVLIKTGL